jgi:hypothetical protein
MTKQTNRSSRPISKSHSRPNVFGPPPLLYNEDEAAYNEMLARVSDSLRPTDFIEQIWIHDLVDAAWNIIRLRRLQAAYLADEAWNEINEEASSVAEANPKLMEGTNQGKEEMAKLLTEDSDLSWQQLGEKYPRADEKYQKFWRAAESTLNKDSIEAKILINNLDTIERVDQLIATAQRRLDTVIREIDRHRFVQHQFESSRNVVNAEFKRIEPIAQATKNKKVA